MSSSLDELRYQILSKVEEYSGKALLTERFTAGKSYVPPSGKVIGAREIQNMVEACLDGWLTTGRFNDAFERKLREFLGVRYAMTTNSGSSANLLAVSALTSPSLGARALKAGDEVITVAAGFPTTVNPIIQNNLIPVFVDIELPTYNIDVSKVESAISPKTRAIVIAHTLGNPFQVETIMEIARSHDLWVVEDCCDALGSKYDGRIVGGFGHIGTLSFYPAHQITMGEGGAVFTKSAKLKKIIESFRDWGRDCFCDPGKDNTCGKRFGWKLGQLPEGYDHKYTYAHAGYNLKITDMQAACGLAQLDKLPDFIGARKKNFQYLRQKLEGLVELLELPSATQRSDPAWFGFPVCIKTDRVSRNELVRFLEDNSIGSRLLFGGNLLKQPYFNDRKFRVAGGLEITDLVMNNAFWLGVYPGLGEPQLDYVADKIYEFCAPLLRGL